MLEERVTCVGAASANRALVATCDHFNYRWMFHTSEASMALVVSRGALLRGSDTEPTTADSFEPHQILPLPAAAQSIALHASSLRVAVACVDGRAMLFGIAHRSPPMNDDDAHWQCEATWRCEADMQAPLQWCETTDDLTLVAAGTRMTSWKVVHDAVTVYAHRSFDLCVDAPVHLLAAASDGRYIATGATPHSRLLKVWCMEPWPSETAAPSCVFLGHARAVCSMEWLDARAQGDNASLLTLDRRGQLTLWREDLNGSPFAFLQTLAIDTTAILSQYSSVNLVACGLVARPMTRPLARTTLNDGLCFWELTPKSEPEHLVYDDHRGVGQAAGFFFRSGATADTHQGEKFIPGNVALQTHAASYVVYGVLDNGDVCFWRLDCVSLLNATPRSHLLGTFSGLRQLFRSATLLHVSTSLSGQHEAPVVAFLLQSMPVGELQRVQLRVNGAEVDLISAVDVYPRMGSHAPIAALVASSTSTMGFMDANETLFVLSDGATLQKLAHPHLELTHTRFPSTTSVVTAVVVLDADLILCATADREILALCGYDNHAKANVLTLATTASALRRLVVLPTTLLGLGDDGSVVAWTFSRSPLLLTNAQVWAIEWSSVLYMERYALGDGAFLLAASSPCSLSTWSVATGAVLHRFDLHHCVFKASRSARTICVHAPYDAVATAQWTVDARTSAIVWLQDAFVLCLARGVQLTLYSGPTVLWTMDMALPQATTFLVHGGTLYMSRGALLTSAVLLPKEPSSPSVWPPLLLFQLLRRGAFKALGRFLDALKRSLEAYEETCYVNMHATPVYAPPRLAWASIMLDPLSGKEDLWTPSRAAPKDCAALLFAPRVPMKTNAQDTVDYEAFFTPARISLLGLSDSKPLTSLASMLRVVDDVEDVPGMKFALALRWREDAYVGLSAEALLWARLSKMDFLMALPWLSQTKWTWDDVRDLRLPFWLDDTAKLREKTEQVAQSAYAASKDPFDVALYYDSFDWPRNKIADLLTNDFADDRWRTAAIKNAFVLKSKGRYMLAATFFLLGGKIYEAAAMAEAADQTLVLSLLICKLAEADANGPVTKQVLCNMVLSRAKACGDVYLEALAQLLLTGEFPYMTLLTPPTTDMRCGFNTTCTTYWRDMNQSLYAACALVRYDFTRRVYSDADTQLVVALHVKAASRLLAQGLTRSAYRCCSDLLESFGDLTIPEMANVMLQHTKVANVCSQLAAVSERLVRATTESFETKDTSELGPLLANLQEELDAFASVRLADVDDRLRQDLPLVHVLATHVSAARSVTAPLHVFLNTILAGGAPWAALRGAVVWTQYLHIVFARCIEPDSSTIRLASTCIYSALCLALPVATKSLDACCVARLVHVLFPQKELHEMPSDKCYTCHVWRPKKKAPASLRQDLPTLHQVLQQLVGLQPKWPPHKAASSTDEACACVRLFHAAAYHCMAVHAARILGDPDDVLSRQWTRWAASSPRVIAPCSNACCPWRHLTLQLAPSLGNHNQVHDATNKEQLPSPSSIEVIYKSQVPGEAVKSMCFNPEQRSTVVHCNGRFIYRSTAKKPRRDAPLSDLSSLCQLQVNTRFSPPPAFANEMEVSPKMTPANPLSPTPDSRSTSYRPIALTAHPSLSVFCAGTTKGNVDLWRFENPTAPLGSFEHHVPTLNPLTQLAAPRRDVHRIRFENSGHTLGACDNVGFVYLWNLARPGATPTSRTRDFTFLNASSCLASVGASTKKKSLCLWDTLLPPQKALISAPVCHPLGATAVVFSSRHQLLISGGESGGLSVFDVRRQRMLHTVSGAHDSAITTLVLHPRGHSVLSGSATGDIKIWALPLFRELASWLTGKAKPVVATFLGDTTSAFVAPTITGVTDAFATDDFFYTSHSDGSIQRCQVPTLLD
ncbi:hypothetical protein SPRG_10758 [Saprolegnia parasitica CBS 223.65]|uniref:RAVE complex protein Rav1 C-terminal domain-containing protein n=1 Tax=Saprolegnia parasitica (strain CBS 223.65) TaxID=695850 RepID=A0A067BZ55_SAPPC|nr:hypothetical protein SPRG_10758 [Saprolegnia parasitica CBS 223.65]KDO23563.1 hypothetical protein SPRG_10758 [Saprolegnia parasitica CBS 223.65]|eukprot:XP_012205713.1 hypothetical protein SPRG_10758 [Saprolegnia parasitica CBS 223.65]